MFISNIWVRLALLAALTSFPLPALAQIAAELKQENRLVIISGLLDEQRELLSIDSKRVSVRIDGATSSRGMAIRVVDDGENLIVEPKFPLRAGTNYLLSIALNDDDFKTVLSIPQSESSPPTLLSFEPSQSVIPANTLRFYLQFSEPMARGNLLESISLIGPDGDVIPSPFLKLETELWDPSQTRATLLFDPGRIKQGVGPNNEVGAPLTPGESYRIVVHDSLKSAVGINLAKNVSVSFKAGEPERRAISAEAWDILVPHAGSNMPLSVSFDRIMDTGAAQRLLTLEGPEGNRIFGRIDTDGGGWTLHPEEPWRHGAYQLIIAPDMEDVSGNTINAAFDAGPDTIGKSDPSKSLKFQISTN